MSAAGWTQDSFHVSHQEDRDGLRPVYVALFRRTAYDAEGHALRRAAHEKAAEAYFAKRDQIEGEVKSYRAERHLGAP